MRCLFLSQGNKNYISNTTAFLIKFIILHYIIRIVKMSKAKFEIGENEKHIININANPFLKYIRIEVDGERVVDVPNLIPSRKFDLEVGNPEKHKVDIYIRALSPIRMMVDGKEVAQI